MLSPDAIWLTIAQGVAQHVRLNAEALRPRLVRHTGREAIKVDWLGELPTTHDAWRDIIDAFREKVAEHTGPGLARLLVCDFSTSTDVDRIASEIVLMDAVSPYFDFFVACVCGIPEVTLTGTPEDWRKIRERIDVIEELELRQWARSLKPIADEFVRASEGRPDVAMWRRIYKPRKAYGWKRITGWVARLFPYVKSAGTVSVPNPLLALRLSQPDDTGSPNEWYNGPGIALEDAPCGPSSMLVRVEDLIGGRTEELEASGGLMGIEQDEHGALRPVSAYVIRRPEASILDVADRIVREHRYTVDERDPLRSLVAGTAEQIALAERIGTATLAFSGERTWRLRGRRDRELVDVKLSDGTTELIQRWLDLPNGLFLAHALTRKGSAYVLGDERFLVRPPPLEGTDPVTGLSYAHPPIEVWPKRLETTQWAQDVPVVGSSLAAILLHALEHDGELPPRAPSTLDDHAVIPIVPQREPPARDPRSA
ncbi:hypothetical protein AKJ09_02508 [Labilithrix luteola]|uniref:DUF4419 domain-containing protein n=1 Tax=Labilithrix luteola TaxID=1391654 RepID=A0A0K1PRU4_9BACT|nr:hypothetical protein AKJ09_02508 [Labilithrix luteola]